MTRSTLAAYGHSWAYGTGATGHRGFAALVAETLGLSLDNQARSGSLSADTAALVETAPPPAAGIFVLMTGLNDARRHGDSPAALAAYADALARVVGAFGRAGPAAPLLVVVQPRLLDYAGFAPFDQGSDAVVDAYNAIVATVPGVRPVRVDGWDPRTMLDPDGVHPNDAGHACLAAAVVNAARPPSTPHPATPPSRSGRPDEGPRPPGAPR